jgi:4-hydroxybenzoyl-CoA reductase subunit beta
VQLPKFDYLEAGSIQEASTALIERPDAKVFSGGTDLLVNMKHRVEKPSLLVNLKKLPGLNSIRMDQGTLRIGALVRLKNLQTDPFILEKAPVLATAASAVGSYHHQVMGTIGGNICQQNRCKYFNQSPDWLNAEDPCYKSGGDTCHVSHSQGVCYSSYCGDIAPALTVLDAKVTLQNGKSSREIPVEGLFSGSGMAPLLLRQGDILTEILIKEESLGGFSTYVKFVGRKRIDFPVVGMAFWASFYQKKYRICFTAVDRRPLRAHRTEGYLRGRDLDSRVLAQAEMLASKEAQPVKTSIYSPAYKQRLMGLLLRQVLDELAGRFG